MAKVSPWGHIDWLMPRIGTKKWQAIACASFEERSEAIPEWISKQNNSLPHYVIRVAAPPNKYSEEIKQLTDKKEKNIRSYLGKKVDIRYSDLLTGQGDWNELANDCANDGASLVLDISAMPKRMFLFLVKRLMASPNVQDLIVCYTKPEKYKEGRLTNDAEPPAALPGFGRISSKQDSSTVVVGAGYMAFNLEELLEQSRGKFLKFLFPFPPGSPNVRRNWNLLHQLAPAIHIQTEIRRIHAMDMFTALEWLTTLKSEASGAIDMIPLGPKPHALAMALVGHLTII